MMLNEADRAPDASGAKVTEMLQDPRPASVLVQVFWLRGKSLVLAPVNCSGPSERAAVLRLLIVIAFVLPVLPTVTVPKLMDVGLTLMAVNPLPLMLSVSGLLLAFPEIFMVAEIFPTTVGVNTTV